MTVSQEKDLPPEVEALRTYAAAEGVPLVSMSDKGLLALLNRTKNDVDFALIALRLDPRPAWVTEALA